MSDAARNTVPYHVPYAPAALAALPNDQIALYDPQTRQVVVYSAAPNGKLFEVAPLHPPAPEPSPPCAPDPFCEWAMAANAPLVVGLNDGVGLWTLAPHRAPAHAFGGMKFTRLVALDPRGRWAIMQDRRELVLLDLQTQHCTARWAASTADVQSTAGGMRYLAHLEGDATRSLVVQRCTNDGLLVEKARARVVPPAGAGVPLHVYFSSDVHTQVLYVVYGALEERGAGVKQRITLQRWQMMWGETPSVSATQAVHFAEPFDDFATIPGTGQRACAWPKRGGYVLESWRGDEPFTSRVRPVGTKTLTLWVPHDMPNTIHVSATGV